MSGCVGGGVSKVGWRLSRSGWWGKKPPVRHLPCHPLPSHPFQSPLSASYHPYHLPNHLFITFITSLITFFYHLYHLLITFITSLITFFITFITFFSPLSPPLLITYHLSHLPYHLFITFITFLYHLLITFITSLITFYHFYHLLITSFITSLITFVTFLSPLSPHLSPFYHLLRTSTTFGLYTYIFAMCLRLTLTAIFCYDNTVYICLRVPGQPDRSIFALGLFYQAALA